jgi:isopenicillin N synthase-like dioxygenase
LCEYLFTREDVYGNNFSFNAAKVDCIERNSITFGRECLKGFKTNGYLRLRLTKDERKAVSDAISVFKEFSNLPMSEKEEYAYTSIKSAQPQFGYRSTALHKEYFVCREIQSLSLDTLKYPNECFETTIGYVLNTLNAISRTILKAILQEMNAEPSETDCIMKGLSLPAKSLDTFGFTDMMEIFRYKGDVLPSKPREASHENLFLKNDGPRFSIPCGDHRDVALFTLLPKCLGPSGLEIYDWEGGWTNAEAQIDDNECIVLAGELLHRLTAGKICPTSHRVIIQLSDQLSDQPSGNDRDNDRYSSPCELLLNPLYKIDCQKLFPNDKNISDNFKCIETSQDYISSTSQKLVSVNK